MAALKLKERWDEYKQLPSHDEEGGVRLPSSPLPGDDDDDVSMLDTQIPGIVRPKRPKRKGCCVCCGLNCSLFWKAFGIVLLLLTLWNGFKLIKWAVTPSPTGLESMPKYSSSLGCDSAPYIYGDAKTSYTIPVGSSKPNHALTIRGAAVGTLVIAEAPVDATNIALEMTLRTDDQSLLSSVRMDIESTTDPLTHAALTTPLFIDPHKSCMRYDMTLYVPSTLKTLELSMYSVTQIQFHPDAHITLDNLLVKMNGMGENNMFLPNAGVRATNMDVGSSSGWIVGDMAIVNSTSVTTMNGNCVANVHLHPAPPINPEHPEPAYLITTHGNGRADFFYESDHAYPHRPIVSSHTSTRNGDLYLTYKNAEYSGSIDLRAQSYTAHGMQVSHLGQTEDGAKTLPWVGNKDGGDKLVISSPKGWVGLYF